jgi:hypothetical protein
MQDGITEMARNLGRMLDRVAAMEARRDKLRDEQRSHSHVPPAVDFGSSLVDGITAEYLDSLDWEGLIVMKKGAYALPLPYPQTNKVVAALTTAGFNEVEALSAATPALLGVILGLSPGGDGEASVASMVGGIFQVLVNMTSHGLRFHQDVHERSSGHSYANKHLRRGRRADEDSNRRPGAFGVGGTFFPRLQRSPRGCCGSWRGPSRPSRTCPTSHVLWTTRLWSRVATAVLRARVEAALVAVQERGRAAALRSRAARSRHLPQATISKATRGATRAEP